MSLFHTYNNENILIRAVLAGLLDILNNKIKYKQAWADDDVETVEVPWFYNQSGDERFMQDFYTHYAHCMPPRPVDGNFDMVPRGVITYSGSTIDEQRITSRYVQGTYVKDDGNGNLEQYVSFLYSIPLNVSIECNMLVDTQITALKIEQEIRETFYKNVTYYVYYKGMRVGCTVGFPANTQIDKSIQYSHEADNQIKLDFSLEIEAYQPVFDPTTEQLASSKMNKFGYTLYVPGQKDGGNIVITTPSKDAVVPKGFPLWIEWVFTKEGAVMPKVDLFWLNVGNSEAKNDIELNVHNNEFYIWNIPDDFTSFNQPKIIWEDSSVASVHREPVVSIIPNLATGVIDASSFNVIENGYFICQDNTDSSIGVSIEITDASDNVYYSDTGAVYFNLKYNQIDTANPVTVDPSALIRYPNAIDYREIEIHVANATDPDAFGKLSSIKIV